ncbi:uncharacterized protein LOC134848706 [Symsagittifera roscoffensis]|uniref:uncharacterized protein LOC134848706 n=1 Tax=Symsagittifera roscoffensis TaxID=84072 RepID=UPI00307B6893
MMDELVQKSYEWCKATGVPNAKTPEERILKAHMNRLWKCVTKLNRLKVLSTGLNVFSESMTERLEQCTQKIHDLENTKLFQEMRRTDMEMEAMFKHDSDFSPVMTTEYGEFGSVDVWLSSCSKNKNVLLYSSVTGQPIHKNDFVLVEKFSKKQSNGKSFWKYAKKNTAHLNTKNQNVYELQPAINIDRLDLDGSLVPKMPAKEESAFVLSSRLAFPKPCHPSTYKIGQSVLVRIRSDEDDERFLKLSIAVRNELREVFKKAIVADLPSEDNENRFLVFFEGGSFGHVIPDQVIPTVEDISQTVLSTLSENVKRDVQAYLYLVKKHGRPEVVDKERGTPVVLQTEKNKR